MARTKLTASEWENFTQRKFYVKTTNDVSQSNCKLADDKETIVATRIITTGEEIQCYYDATDNNKSAGDKRPREQRLRVCLSVCLCVCVSVCVSV